MVGEIGGNGRVAPLESAALQALFGQERIACTPEPICPGRTPGSLWVAVDGPPIVDDLEIVIRALIDGVGLVVREVNKAMHVMLWINHPSKGERS
jgi:hypothetical protein